MKILLNCVRPLIRPNAFGKTTLCQRNDRHLHGVLFFSGIMEVLSLMKLDMANFNIRQYRPLLQQQAVAYEKSTFDKFMDNQRGEHRVKMPWNDRCSLCSYGCRSSRRHMQMARTCVRSTKNKDYRRCVSTSNRSSKFDVTHTSIRDSQRSVLRIVDLES